MAADPYLAFATPDPEPTDPYLAFATPDLEPEGEADPYLAFATPDPEQSTVRNVVGAAGRGALDQGLYSGIEGAARLSAAGLEDAKASLPGTEAARLQRERETLTAQIVSIEGVGRDQDTSYGAVLTPADEAQIAANRRRILEVGAQIDGRRAATLPARYAGAVADTRASIREALPVDAAFEQSLGGQIISGLGQAAGTLPLYAIPGAGPGVTVGQMFDQGYQDAKARGTDEATANQAGFANVPAAALDVLADRLVIGKILKPLRGRVTVGQVAKAVALVGAGEGATEGAQQVWQNLVASQLVGYDPERPLDDQVINSIIVGTVVGGGVSLTGQGATRLAERRAGATPAATAPTPAPGEAVASATEEAAAFGADPYLEFATLDPEQPAPASAAVADDLADVTPDDVGEAEETAQPAPVMEAGPGAGPADSVAGAARAAGERSGGDTVAAGAGNVEPGAAPAGADDYGVRLADWKRKAKQKGATIKLGPRGDGGFDVLDALQDLGGISRGKGGEGDGFADAFGRGAARLLVRRSAQPADVRLGELAEMGFRYDTPDALYAAVRKAVEERRAVGEARRGEADAAKFRDAALEGKGRRGKQAAGKAVGTDTLRVGDRFALKGEAFEVTGVDPETLDVIVRDGPRFGTQVLPAGSSLLPDKRTLRRAKPEAPAAGDAPFARRKQAGAVSDPGQLDAFAGGETGGDTLFNLQGATIDATIANWSMDQELERREDVARRDRAQSELLFAERTADPERAAADRAELAALQAKWRANAERIAPGLMQQFRLAFGDPEILARMGRVDPKALTGAEEAAYLGHERMLFLFDQALLRSTDKEATMNLLHEMGHAHWDTLPAARQAELLEEWQTETGARTGPLYTGGKLKRGVALGVEASVKEWYAERLAWTNSRWARTQLPGTGAVGRMGLLFRKVLVRLADFVEQLRGIEIDRSFRAFLTQGAGRWAEVAAPEFSSRVTVPRGAGLDKPITGPSGAKIVGYQWRSTIEDRFDQRDGGYVAKRVSDWATPGTSTGTGREIVHVFYVEKDGAVTTEGINSAQNLLGISAPKLRSIAERERLTQQRRKTQEEALVRRFESYAKPTAAAAMEHYFTRNGGVSRVTLQKMSVALEKDGRFVALPKTTAGDEQTLRAYGWGDVGAAPAVEPRRSDEGGQMALFARRTPAQVAEDSARNAGTWLRRNLTSAAGLPPEVFAAKLAKDGRLASIEKQMKFALRDLDRAMHAVYGGYRAMTKAQLAEVDEVLGGRRPLSTVDPRLHAPLHAMRTQIDTLSARLVREGAIDAKLHARVGGNIGFYLNRSYRKFDDKNWARKVPAAVRNQAETFIAAELAAQNPGQPVDPREVQGYVDYLLSKDTANESLYREPGKLGAKALDVMKARKDIPPELRALMGEYGDPRVDYLRSVAKTAQILEANRFLRDVRRAGMGKWLFPRPVTDATGAYVVPIAPKGSEAMSPLNGLYTTKEIAQAFEGQREAAPGQALRAWLALNGWAKVAKTVLSPVTQARNLFGNLGFVVAGGHLRTDATADVWRAMQAEFGRGDTQARRDYLARLARLGIVGESINAGELREALVDGGAKLQGFEEWTDTRLMKVLKSPFSIAARLYQLNDEIFKIYVFENERRSWAKVDPTLTGEQLDRIAAERVRNTLPTYSLIPKAVQTVRRVGLTGSFLSFPSEVVRTTYHSIRYMLGDLASANPRQKAMGARRLVGLLAVATLPAVVGMLTRWLASVDKDDEEDVRRFLPPWSENSSLYFTKADGKGRFEMIDASYLDPWNYLKKPLMAALRGEDWQASLAGAGREALTPFAGEGLVVKAAVDLARNSDEQGRPVFNPQAPFLDRTYEQLAHVWRVYEPGAVTQARRIVKAGKGEVSPGGRLYDLENEVAALLTGARRQDVDVAQSIQFRAKRYAGERQGAELIFKEVRDRKGTVTPEELETARAKMETSRRALFDRMKEDAAAVQRLGVSRSSVMMALMGAGLGETDAALILGGVYMPYHGMPDFRQRAMQEAVARRE